MKYKNADNKLTDKGVNCNCHTFENILFSKSRTTCEGPLPYIEYFMYTRVKECNNNLV